MYIYMLMRDINNSLMHSLNIDPLNSSPNIFFPTHSLLFLLLQCTQPLFRSLHAMAAADPHPVSFHGEELTAAWRQTKRFGVHVYIHAHIHLYCTILEQRRGHRRDQRQVGRQVGCQVGSVDTGGSPGGSWICGCECYCGTHLLMTRAVSLSACMHACIWECEYSILCINKAKYNAEL